MSAESHARRRWLLFPGMNPQGNVFEKLAPLVGECELIEWRLPKNQSSIAHLAAEIVTEWQIDENCDLLGVSFGGVVAQEVAQLSGSPVCVVVSSICSRDELPAGSRILRLVPRFLFSSLLCLFASLSRCLPRAWLGAKKALVQKFSGSQGTWYRWATWAVLHAEFPVNRGTTVVRIHGDRDVTFADGHRRAAHVIKGAGHMLVWTHAAEVAHLMRVARETISTTT